MLPQLYNQYAKPLKLHESILLILYVSDHKDPYLLEQTWDEIIKGELRSCFGHCRDVFGCGDSALWHSIKLAYDTAPSSRLRPFEAIGNKVKELGRRFYPSETVFPLGKLLSHEKRNAHRMPRRYR